MKTLYITLFIVSLVTAGHAIIFIEQPRATAHFLVAAVLAWLFWMLRECEK